MRKNIVAGNWKMNKGLSEGIELAKEVAEKVANKKNDALVILGTPFIHLSEVSKIVDNKDLFLSAQNCSNQPAGAYTGEVSAEMIKSTGAEYVILGHSERRAYYGETDEILAEKVNLALVNSLKPIFCVGEVLEEREKGVHFEIVKKQLNKGLFHLTEEQFNNIVVAYEPVWAIGTGKTASSDQAQEMHKVIREELAAKFGTKAADSCTILYGGSCKPSNAKELFANPDVDGGLIGGASLNADDFMGIIEAFG
jgi:triosephosphate isomerase